VASNTATLTRKKTTHCIFFNKRYNLTLFQALNACNFENGQERILSESGPKTMSKWRRVLSSSKCDEFSTSNNKKRGCFEFGSPEDSEIM